MRCKMCSFWLRDFSLPEKLGYCSAKGAISIRDDVCEFFRRRESEQIAIRVYNY
ncbi:MAG: hypothetical protein QXV61_03940 [Archaeoglobaceae archaeon]